LAIKVIFLISLLALSSLLHARTYQFVADVSYYYATSYEGHFVAGQNFLDESVLREIPYTLGSWKGESLNSQDTNILYQRRYFDPNDETTLYFSVVHGRSEGQFHTPEVCYSGAGWDVTTRRISTLPLRSYSFPLRYSVASHDGYTHLVLYWYMWADSNRLTFKGMTMFRISVRVDKDIESAEKKAFSFIQALSTLGEKSGLKRAKSRVKNSHKSKVSFEGKLYAKEMEHAYKWLVNQMVPGPILARPPSPRRHLLISYRVPLASPVYRWVFSKAAIYDNALAVIAFSMVGDFERAEKIIDALKRLQSDSGSLWFTVNTHNMWPSDRDNGGAIIRSGASAWVGMAITYYLQRRALEDGDFLTESPAAKRHLQFARSIANRLISRQVVSSVDPRYGFITGGEGRYSIEWQKDKKRSEEIFYPGKIEWASVEHNIDAYFFLRDLYYLFNDPVIRRSYRLLKKYLLAKSWNGEIKQFNRGQNLEGSDTVEALDTASWGAALLQAVGNKKYARIAIEKVEKFAVIKNSKIGYRPYINLLVYEDQKINRLIYPEDPTKNWSQVSMHWHEGTLGVALSHLKLGNREQAEKIVASVLKSQNDFGALSYADTSIPFQFSDNPSVASTAWLLMVLASLNSQQDLDLFWAEDRPGK
jgi:hypothetical protein